MFSQRAVYNFSEEGVGIEEGVRHPEEGSLCSTRIVCDSKGGSGVLKRMDGSFEEGGWFVLPEGKDLRDQRVSRQLRRSTGSLLVIQVP